MEVTNRFEGLDLSNFWRDWVPEELWMEVYDIVQEAGIKTMSKKKKYKKAKWLSEEPLQIPGKTREAKGKGEKERYTHLNAEFQRIAGRAPKNKVSRFPLFPRLFAMKWWVWIPATIIPACASSSPAFCVMFFAYKLNLHGNNIQPLHIPFPIWNQSVGPCSILTVASWCIQISQEEGKVVWFPHFLKSFLISRFQGEISITSNT